MNQEDREMANAALALDETINERVIQALTVNSFAVESIVMDIIRNRCQYDSTFQSIIAKIIKDRIREL